VQWKQLQGEKFIVSNDKSSECLHNAAVQCTM